MSAGDVVGSITAGVGANATTTFQPASGVSILVFDVGAGAQNGTTPNITPSVDVGLTDGTNTIWLSYAGNPTWYWQKGITINNSLYLILKNRDSASQPLGYSGVQLK